MPKKTPLRLIKEHKVKAKNQSVLKRKSNNQSNKKSANINNLYQNLSQMIKISKRYKN